MAAPTTRSQVYFGPPYSVAVLPFNCVRPGSSYDGVPLPDLTAPYLTFGLAESVQNQLQQMEELQVTAVSSSFFFAGSAEPLPVLAERLKVRHLLDGCIRRSGEDLDLEVRLYDVRDASFLWSETLSTSINELTDVVNQAVSRTAEEVRKGSGGNAPLMDAIDGDAFRNMLEGRHYFRGNSLESLEQAQTSFRAVLDIEPGFAPAWLGLGRIYLHPAWSAKSDEPGYELSRVAAMTALELDAGLAGAHLLLSFINRVHDWDFAQARKEARLALDLLPGDAEILANASSAEFVFGRYKASIALLERSISRNPVVLNKLFRLGLVHEFARDYDQALIIYRQLLGLNPDYPGTHAFRARVKLAQGNPESALKESEQEMHPFWQRYARILALDALDRFEESDPLLNRMALENSHNAAFQLAEIHAMRDDPEGAFKWLELAMEQRDGGMSEILGNVFLEELHDDPRWTEMVNRMGLR